METALTDIDSWDMFAEKYELLKEQFDWKADSHLADAIGPYLSSKRGDSTIIDLGVGGGEVLLRLDTHVDLSTWIVYGIDISQVFLDRSKQNLVKYNGNFVPIQRDLTADPIPFGDDTIDVVVSAGMIGDSVESNRMLKEVYRVLAPGGIAGINGNFSPHEVVKTFSSLPIRYHQLDTFYAYMVVDSERSTKQFELKFPVRYTQLIVQKE